MFNFSDLVVTRNEEETSSLAKDFMLDCKNGSRIILNGDLGAGKTIFVKEALASIGIGNVSSPSFAIVNEYQNGFHVYHFDFYRIKKISELFDIGWQDYINDEQSIMFIEWGMQFPNVLPSERIEINIRIINEKEREFSFEKFG